MFACVTISKGKQNCVSVVGGFSHCLRHNENKTLHVFLCCAKNNAQHHSK